jgi:membrane protease YdiL (CAAX protease family)
MTSAALRVRRPALIAVAPWSAPAGLVVGLAVIVGARWWATRAGADPLWVGVAFGLVLAVAATLGRTMPAPRGATADGGVGRGRLAGLAHLSTPLAAGAVFGLLLVAITVAGQRLGGGAFMPGTGRPAAPFVPWAAVTILVAGAEEALLRGRLFDAVRRARGVIPAVFITTVAFALMHVPLYGWHVVPLDLAVGLGLVGLRLATGGIAAPAAAHVVADLATWWL